VRAARAYPSLILRSTFAEGSEEAQRKLRGSSEEAQRKLRGSSEEAQRKLGGSSEKQVEAGGV